MSGLIVIAIIIVYLLVGAIVLRPALPMLYTRIQHHYRHGLSWQKPKADDPESIIPWVAFWYGCLILMWPVGIPLTLSWIFVRRNTPQYVEHQTAIKLKKAKEELAEANRIIKEFTNRNKEIQ